MDATLDRYLGVLLGLAVGDAVGTTVEFKPRGTFTPVTDMGAAGLRPGACRMDSCSSYPRSGQRSHSSSS